MRRIRWDSPWTIYLLMLVSALPLGAILAATNRMPEGACSGIGFGCSLYGWDAVAFAAIFVGAPYAVVLALVLLALSRLPEDRRWVARAVAWSGLALPWLLALRVGGLV